MPLSVLSKQGYSKQELAEIKNTCQSEWNAETGSWNYVVSQKKGRWLEHNELVEQFSSKVSSGRKVLKARSSSATSKSPDDSSSGSEAPH